MRVVVVGAGVGGLACAVRLATAGHDVTVLEQGLAPGGKAGRVVLEDGGTLDVDAVVAGVLERLEASGG